MKKFTVLVMMAAVVMFSASCRTAACAGENRSLESKKLRVGFYVDDGSRGGGVLKLARLIAHTPQFELILMDGKDLRDGKLSGVDMLLMPGGSSQKQYESMQETGAKAVRDFVSSGGAYFG